MRRILAFGLGVTLAAPSLTGCGGGATDMDYTSARGTNSDIAAIYEHGPTSLYPGMNFTIGSEPLGTYPWQLNENH